MDRSPHMVPRMSTRGRPKPTPQTGGERDDEQLLQLADELSEREGIPVEAAWSIVSRHHSPSVTGGTYGS